MVRVALPVPLYRTFDYRFEAEGVAPCVGGRVAVRFAHRPLIGICTELDPADAFEDPSPIEQALDERPLLDDAHLQLAIWLSEYYHHPIGEVLTAMLPAEARRGAEAVIEHQVAWRVTASEAARVSDAVTAENARALGLGRAKQQFALLRNLSEQGPRSRAALAELGFSTAVLKALAERGLIESVRWQPRPRPIEPPAVTLNTEQQAAAAAITAQLSGFTPHLLDGITGSGKTEVYMAALDAALADGGQALLLVPEIGLTPQTVRRLQARFHGVVMLHSAMNDAERWQAWLRCRAGEARVLIGTRSAVFTSFADLRMIIVDEEHDASFKQQDGLRYSARDFAVMRARTEQIPVVLGSATPSLESLHNALEGRYRHLLLRQRAGNAELPPMHLLDIRGHELVEGLSPQLLHVMRRHLKEGGQVLTFINRRGFAPTLMCAGCGWIASCRDCDVRLTLHSRPQHLRCHHCGHSPPLSERCPDCGSGELLAVGAGTQRTEQAMETLFPEVPVLRIDRDTSRSQQALNAQLAQVHDGHPMVLVGTQMLAKGHDFPDVTMVAVLGADGGFFSADFRAPERMAQTIMQVAGRAGRSDRRGEVWVQTNQPEHPLLQRLRSEGYDAFARSELSARAAAEMPPYRPMALLRADAFSAEEGHRFLSQLKRTLPGVEAYGPAPAPVQRIKNRFRQQLLLIGADRSQLRRALLKVRSAETPRQLRWSIDVDPYDSF